MEADIHGWAPWSPAELHRRFGDLRQPWYIAGGWAIDLYLQQATREHDDIEIGIRAADLAVFADRLTDCELFVVGHGQSMPLAAADESTLRQHHQTWVRDAGGWRLDIFREPFEGDLWVARRDRRQQLAYRDLILKSSEGIPFACPEAVLLFKAKAKRPKDDADFRRVLPQMTGAARRWLADALGMVHPGHEWSSLLVSSP